MRRGCLFLDRENRVADGRRSAVHRAPLMATLGPRGGAPRRVAVVAKTAKADCRSHHLLRNEGKAYSTMPSALSEPPESLASSSALPADVWAPVVPRFYGLYIPVDAEGKKLCGCHQDCDGYIHADCPVDWATPILLMEDCGVPVDLGRMRKAERKQCWSLVDRLHEAGVAHGSAYPRNMLAQPGPLSLPRSERSMATPSFRIASFGRTEVLWPRPGPPTRLAVHSFQKVREQDVQTVLSALRLWEEDEEHEQKALGW
ncbi:hypothetical protein C8Q79DRAFT_901707 [Trametes meyenii]|nr:hypothetical protein C8Q79DRAFT_901707 [Trametes meyenii]